MTLDDPRTSVATLFAQATLPPPDAGRIAAPTCTFEQATAADNGRQFQPLEQQHQYLVLVNQSPQRLEQEARDAVEAIPAVDLPIKISQAISDQAAEILRVRDTRRDRLDVQGAQQHQVALGVGQPGENDAGRRPRRQLAGRGALPHQQPVAAVSGDCGCRPGRAVLSLFVADRPSRPIDPKRAAEPNLVLVPLAQNGGGRSGGRGEAGLRRPLRPAASQRGAGLAFRARPAARRRSCRRGKIRSTGFRSPRPNGRSFCLPTSTHERIDDATKSNVTESEAGVEEIIAGFNEMLNLYQMVHEARSAAARSQAKNNLKQIGMAAAQLPRHDAGLIGRQLRFDAGQYGEQRPPSPRSSGIAGQASEGRTAVAEARVGDEDQGRRPTRKSGRVEQGHSAGTDRGELGRLSSIGRRTSRQ